MSKNKSKAAKTQQKALQFKKAEYRIRCGDGSNKSIYQPVTGFVAEGSLLAYHQNGLGCSIDHLPTGFRVCEFDSRSQAQKFVRKASNLDWKFRNPRSPKLKKIGPAIKAMGADIHIGGEEE